MKFNKFISLSVLGIAMLLSSCMKEEYRPDLPAEARSENVRFDLFEEERDSIATKSILTDASIETKQTCVTVGLYCDGALVDKAYATSFSGINFTLAYNKQYTLYALANMGDLRSTLPSSESSLSTFTYTIPAYTGTSNSVNTLGIPMAGSLSYECGVSSVTAIPVKRLLAKVTANLSCDWAGAKITSAKVYNMNSKLVPFGTSAATGAGDMLSFQELQTASGSGTTSLLATFYVPENMQGTVSGITVSSDKAGDRNASVAANAAKLTYLQVEVDSDGKYDGTVVYRSYLGNNATTNFDIKRNGRYVWTIHYASATIDGWIDDWKHDYDGLEVIDYSLSLAPATKTIAPGENFSYTTTLNRNVIRPTASTTSVGLTNSDATWSSSNTAVATVNSSGIVTGVSAGTANITARYTPSGPDFSERSATASVTVQSVSHELEVTGSPLEKDYSQSIQLTAKYYTITDGVKDSGVDVTTNTNLSWSRYSGSEYVSVGTHTGLVTASNYGEAVIRASYTVGGDTYTDDVSVKFNRTDRYLDLTASPTTQVAGSNINLTASVRTVTNGVASFVSVSAGSIAWSVYQKSVAGAVVNVTSGGVLTSDRATTIKMRGTYDGLEGFVDVTFTALTSKYIDIIGSPLTKNVGETISLSAKLYVVTDGTPDAGTTITPTWDRKSGSTNISVSASGAVTATDYGTAVIRARYNPGDGELTDEVTVTFNKTTHSLVITPAAPAAVNVGQTINLTATYYTYYNGSETGVENVTLNVGTSWTRGDSKVTVTMGTTYAQVTASAGVTTTVSASYGGLTTSVNVTFNDVITYSLEITPSPATASVSVGSTITLSAKFYTTTNGVKNAGVAVTPTWTVTSGGPNISVTSAGVVSATTGGSGTVQASYSYGGNTYTASQTVAFGNVDVEKYRLVISPASATISWNETQSYSISRYTDIYRNGSLYSSGTTPTAMSASDFNWTSTSTTVATVSAAGIATGAGGGTTTIKATLKSSVAEYAKYNNIEVTSSLTVNNVVSHRLAVTPSSSSAMKGETISLTATYYTTTNGVEDSGTNVTTDSGTTWSHYSGSSNVSVNNTGTDKGKVTAVSYGSATIRAIYNGYSASATVNFSAYRFKISPKTADNYELGISKSKTFLVTRYLVSSAGTESGETAMSNTDFNWSSSATARATVTTAGVVTGVAEGSVTITVALKTTHADYAKFLNTSETCTMTIISGTSTSWEDDWDDGGGGEIIL